MTVIDRDRWRVLQPLLDRALSLAAVERDGLLDEVRAQSPTLASELVSLLAREAAADQSGFLSVPLEDVTLAGLTMGAYTLEELIGHGGMGSVWLAHRSDGRFQGKAAVKLLNLALVSASGQEQLRREGSALARLAHTGIARLLDAGVGPTGQPYLVLEYVEGKRIDLFAAERSLTAEQRIQLFLQVLAAVSHAHANLIVHRDLKPSNILVTADGTAKLLDFGLAKLIQPGAPLVDGEPAQRTRHRWMTPEYAAPEQIRGEPVTTRTDVYQLGAVLYELLTGRTPFVADCLHKLEAAILAGEPERPSVANNLESEGRRRSGGAVRGRQLRGDLDAIVLRAMRADPEQRYASVEAFADDLRRYLARHPVLARRQTTGYRLWRLVRRRRLETATAVAIAGSLLSGAALSRSEARRAREERARAEVTSRESEAVTSLLLRLFDADDPEGGQTDTLSARGLLQRGIAGAGRLRDQPIEQARMFEVVARAYFNLGRYTDADDLLERAVLARRNAGGGDRLDVARTLGYLADVFVKLGRYRAADSAAREALTIRERALGPWDPAVATSLHQMGSIAVYRGNVVAAEAYHRRALQVREQKLGTEDSMTAASHISMGGTLRYRGRLTEAEQEYRRALQIYERVLPPNHPDVASAAIHLAYLLDEERGRYAEAEPLYKRALEIRRRAFGTNHPMFAYTLSDMSSFLARRGDSEGAVRLAREHLEIIRHAFGPEHPRVATSIGYLANTLYRAGKLPEADSLFRRGIAMDRRLRGVDHPNVAGQEIGLARLLIDRGEYAAADTVLGDAIRIFTHSCGPVCPSTARSQGILGRLLARRGDYSAGDSLLRHAIDVVERQIGREHHDVRELYGWLADLHVAWGHPAEATRFRAIAAAR